MSWFEKNTGNKNGIGTGGIGYVIMPSKKMGISEYMQQCYRSNEITIGGDGYGTMSHVKVANGLMQHIEFPNDDDGRGSLVVWVRESFYNRPIIVGILSDNDTANIVYSGQGKNVQEYGGISIGTFTDALNGILSFLAVGNETKPVKVIIKASGSEDDDVEISSTNKISNISKSFSVESTENFKVEINNGEKQIIAIEGDVDKFCFKDFRGNEIMVNNYESSEDEDNESNEEIKRYIQVKDTFGRNYLFNEEKAEITDQFEHKIIFNADEAHYTDKFNNEAVFDENNIQFKCKKFNVGDGGEHMVLGDTLKDLLEQLIGAINSITVPTPYGPSGTPLNSAQFNSIKSQLSKILSQLSNTD